MRIYKASASFGECRSRRFGCVAPATYIVNGRHYLCSEHAVGYLSQLSEAGRSAVERCGRMVIVKASPMSVVPDDIRGPAPRGAYRRGYDFGRYGHGGDMRNPGRPYAYGMLAMWERGRVRGEQDALSEAAG